MQTTQVLELDHAWAYGPGIVHGGFLVQTMTAQALDGAEHDHPLAVSTHFLSAPRAGEVEIRLTPLRAGRSTSTTRAELMQGDRVCLDTVITHGRLGSGEITYLDTSPPALPPVEECVRNLTPEGAPRNGIVEQLEIWMDPSLPGWMGPPGAQAQVQGWIRPASGADCTVLDLICLADALPPVPFALGLPGWVPTVELTVHLRAVPAPGWIRGVMRARMIKGGWLDEECELWDSEGTLVCQARQLAMWRT